MTLNEYQGISQRTSGTPLECSLLGLAGESGEVCDMLKKVLYHKHLLNLELLTKELGDVLWYIADIATKYQITLDDVAQVNIKKLQARYPNGFNTKRSINRDA